MFLLTALSVARTSQSCETGADLAPTPVKKKTTTKKSQSQHQSQTNISEPELPPGHFNILCLNMQAIPPPSNLG